MDENIMQQKPSEDITAVKSQNPTAPQIHFEE